MKEIAIIIFIIAAQVITGMSQTPGSDTIGLYANGIIGKNWQYFESEKTFDNKTIMLKERYENGRIFKEFHRYNDSIFLYTEFYELPDTTVRYRSETWGKKREGLVAVSFQTTGDTISTFNPETYEEHKYMDTLLLPISKWSFYYPGGEKKQSENFHMVYDTAYGNSMMSLANRIRLLLITKEKKLKFI
jgi:hypothetical protein